MKTKRLFCMILGGMLLIGLLFATAQAVEAASSVKVKWDANGGKIGTVKIKSTIFKKSAKIEKFPKTPTRSGYTFQGWYTKKSGGTKITKSTKVYKNVTYYAHWKKVVLPKTIVGHWRMISTHDHGVPDSTHKDVQGFYFFANGSYTSYYKGYHDEKTTQHKSGYYVSNGKIYFDVPDDPYSWPYKLGSDAKGIYLEINGNQYRKIS